MTHKPADSCSSASSLRKHIRCYLCSYWILNILCCQLNVPQQSKRAQNLVYYVVEARFEFRWYASCPPQLNAKSNSDSKPACYLSLAQLWLRSTCFGERLGTSYRSTGYTTGRSRTRRDDLAYFILPKYEQAAKDKPHSNQQTLLKSHQDVITALASLDLLYRGAMVSREWEGCSEWKNRPYETVGNSREPHRPRSYFVPVHFKFYKNMRLFESYFEWLLAGRNLNVLIIVTFKWNAC